MTGSVEAVTAARAALHAVAESILAGHQHRLAGTIRLTVAGDGFATITRLPGTPSGLSVTLSSDGAAHLVLEPEGTALPLEGTLGDLARAAGVPNAAPAGVYDAPTRPDTFPLVCPPAGAAVVLGALRDGDRALREFAAAHGVAPDAGGRPVLWPEHFDVGISLDQVNYGISPGDAARPEPYAYVGPFTPRHGAFWNEPFGAARPLTDLRDVSGIVEFFQEGRRQAMPAGSGAQA